MRFLSVLLLVSALTASCGGGGPDWSAVPERTPHAIGGQISGLLPGQEVTLTDRLGGRTLTITGDGSFQLPRLAFKDDNYNIEIAAQPSSEVCTISNGGGIIAASDVTDISIKCSPVDAVVPLLQAIAGLAKDGFSARLSVAGTALGERKVPASGSMSIAMSGFQPEANLFNGQTALESTLTISDIALSYLPPSGGRAIVPYWGYSQHATIAHTPIGIDKDMFNTAFHTLHCVAVATPPLPAMATSGLSGVLAQYACNTDDTAGVQNGTITTTYATAAGSSAANLTYTQSTTRLDMAGAQIWKITLTFLIDRDGGVSFRGVFFSWGGLEISGAV